MTRPTRREFLAGFKKNWRANKDWFLDAQVDDQEPARFEDIDFQVVHEGVFGENVPLGHFPPVWRATMELLQMELRELRERVENLEPGVR